jgi:hypothetical protein
MNVRIKKHDTIKRNSRRGLSKKMFEHTIQLGAPFVKGETIVVCGNGTHEYVFVPDLERVLMCMPGILSDKLRVLGVEIISGRNGFNGRENGILLEHVKKAFDSSNMRFLPVDDQIQALGYFDASAIKRICYEGTLEQAKEKRRAKKAKEEAEKVLDDDNDIFFVDSGDDETTKKAVKEATNTAAQKRPREEEEEEENPGPNLEHTRAQIVSQQARAVEIEQVIRAQGSEFKEALGRLDRAASQMERLEHLICTAQAIGVRMGQPDFEARVQAAAHATAQVRAQDQAAEISALKEAHAQERRADYERYERLRRDQEATFEARIQLECDRRALYFEVMGGEKH